VTRHGKTSAKRNGSAAILICVVAFALIALAFSQGTGRRSGRYLSNTGNG